nr:Hint domain-containing protein [Pacificibacter marinus]
MDDVARVLFGKDCQSITPAVSALFVSDQVEKLGYASGLSSGALVDTENGPTPIEKLAHGDLVVTQDSDLSPLVALIQSEVPNFGSYRCVELRQPFQNLTQTLSVSKDTHILTGGIDTEYQFGCESVSLRAEHIAPFVPHSQVSGAPVATRYHLILQNSGAFKVAGISVLSLTARHNTRDIDLHSRTRLSHLDTNQLTHLQASTPRLLHEHEATALLSDRYL